MYFKAGTNIVGVPKEMVFVDKKNHPHLLNTLTPKNHLATHYGTSAIGLTTKRGNLVRTVSKGQYTDYKKKVAKQKTAVKKAVKATTELVKAEQQIKKRGRPAGSKNKPKVVASTSDGTPIAVAMTPKKRGRPAGSGKKKV
jgi:23S rRNA maturation mini-RNase III